MFIYSILGEDKNSCFFLNSPTSILTKIFSISYFVIGLMNTSYIPASNNAYISSLAENPVQPNIGIGSILFS